jgi:hypothetical protein
VFKIDPPDYAIDLHAHARQTLGRGIDYFVGELMSDGRGSWGDGMI